MRRLGAAVSLCVLVTCAAPDVLPTTNKPVVIPAAVIDAAPDAATPPEVWLKGSTHVHARPSGDSSTPIPDVLRWYEQHSYDFIVLTDHNRVSELDAQAPTRGEVALRTADPQGGLIVLAGIELTHNPSNCLPAGDPSGKCRIHVNLLGPTGRTDGKLEWANRKTSERLGKYDAALAVQKSLGGIPQINHPNWFWGITGDLLAELARRGFTLFEVSNMAFEQWNHGDKDHASLDTIWDAALVEGAIVWGVASDDAHDYSGTPGAQYPAGGGWIVVKAAREPRSILAAIAAGNFYASTGVVLGRVEVDAGNLVIEVAAGEKGSYTIDWIENGKRVERVSERAARRPLPQTGYLRAVVTRDDGPQAWVQPARR